MPSFLIVGAHADDHFPMGGTIKKLLEAGWTGHFLTFSIAEDSVPEGFPRDVVAEECIRSCRAIGMDTDPIIHRYPVRTIPARRQDVLDELIRVRNEVGPFETVFTHSTSDVHQDHSTVVQEVVRAFRKSSSIYGMDFPWNDVKGTLLNRFEEISESHLRAKLQLVAAFASQVIKANNAMTEEYLRAKAIERGNRIGVRYAEAFEIIREVNLL